MLFLYVSSMFIYQTRLCQQHLCAIICRTEQFRNTHRSIVAFLVEAIRFQHADSSRRTLPFSQFESDLAFCWFAEYLRRWLIWQTDWEIDRHDWHRCLTKMIARAVRFSQRTIERIFLKPRGIPPMRTERSTFPVYWSFQSYNFPPRPLLKIFADIIDIRIDIPTKRGLGEVFRVWKNSPNVSFRHSHILSDPRLIEPLSIHSWLQKKHCIKSVHFINSSIHVYQNIWSLYELLFLIYSSVRRKISLALKYTDVRYDS